MSKIKLSVIIALNMNETLIRQELDIRLVEVLSLFQGNSSYVCPPPLEEGSWDLYDSCVNNVNNPAMYIIFEFDQCYPRYLIKYNLQN